MGVYAAGDGVCVGGVGAAKGRSRCWENFCRPGADATHPAKCMPSVYCTSDTYPWLQESRLHCIGVLHHMTCEVTHCLPAAVGMHRAVPSIRSAFKWQQGHRSEAHEHVIHECQLGCKGCCCSMRNGRWLLAQLLGRLESILTGTG